MISRDKLATPTTAVAAGPEPLANPLRVVLAAAAGSTPLPGGVSLQLPVAAAAELPAGAARGASLVQIQGYCPASCPVAAKPLVAHPVRGVRHISTGVSGTTAQAKQCMRRVGTV